MQKTCIIVPCYNEGKRLPTVSFKSFLERHLCTFLFVNDGSNDDTPEIIKDLKVWYPNKIEILNLPSNMGKAEAVRQGFLTAMSKRRFEYIGYLDADLATPLEEIAFLLKHFDPHVKVVIGSRVHRLGAVIKRDPLRHYLGRIFATLASAVLDIHAYDSQCGAKIFKQPIAENLFKKPFVSKWLFDLELLYRLKNEDSVHFGSNIIEVPLRAWQEKGNSKMKPRDFLAAPFELLKIKRKYKNN